MKPQIRQRAKSTLARVTPGTDGGDFGANPLFPLRPPQGPAFLLSKEYFPHNDTVTEAAGLARSNEATDQYAGSH